MTGYQSKKAAAQDKLEQWDNEAFNDWWDSDYDDSANPYEKDTFAYWAWAGWQAALAQPAQEPVCPECKAGVLYECVACSSNNYPPQGAQKPVAWMYDWLCDGKLITGWIAHSDSEIHKLMASNIRPLYTTPPQRPWVDMTDDELADIWYKESLDWMEFARAVLAKSKEKNNG
jgi:hypothetical protein